MASNSWYIPGARPKEHGQEGDAISRNVGVHQVRAAVQVALFATRPTHTTGETALPPGDLSLGTYRGQEDLVCEVGSVVDLRVWRIGRRIVGVLGQGGLVKGGALQRA